MSNREDQIYVKEFHHNHIKLIEDFLIQLED